MSNNGRDNGDERSINYGLPPDIVLTTLPYLKSEDIKNLSLTNKYFHNLLDFQKSNTLWHELYRKSFGYNYTNDEPFLCNSTQDFKTCSETILVNNYPDATWRERFKLRENSVCLYTWGSLQHYRLGYSYSFNPALPAPARNDWGRARSGISSPTPVPWFTEEQSQSKKGNRSPKKIDNDDKTIVQISAGGFSFQLLTKSGKLFSTGTTYSGGQRGPGPQEGESDFNMLQRMALSMERSYHGGIRDSILTRGVLGMGDRMRIIPNPHNDMYASLGDLQSKCEEYVVGNEHIRRLFPRDVFNFYLDESDLNVDKGSLNKIKFISVSSGRSHILALDEDNVIYSWDCPGMEHGVRIIFEGLPPRQSNPILKIGCGWDFSCVYVYAVGLVVWNSRSALKQGDVASNANYKIIPGTAAVNGNNRILDFACCSGNTLFYITNEGQKLWMYSHGLSKCIDLGLDGRLTKIEASCTSLALFTQQSTYTLKIMNGEIVDGSLTKIDLDPNLKFITLSAGDYHNMALTSDGELYTWGVESELCGCLGLGDAYDAVHTRHVAVFEGARSLKVEKPIKVQLPPDSVAVAIAAGGWHSGALILKK